MTRRPVRGLAARPAAEPAPRPPGPATILGPDGRLWLRHMDGLYYNEEQTEVFSQSALRDLIERADERLRRDIARTEDSILRAIARASNASVLRAIWARYGDVWRPEYTVHVRGRRAVLELPPKEGS